MIHGSVLESRDLNEQYRGNDFDVVMYMVANPYDDMKPYPDSIWVTVYFAALHENLTMGQYVVPNVPHHLHDSSKHAFELVDIQTGIRLAIADAIDYLAYLVANTDHPLTSTS